MQTYSPENFAIQCARKQNYEKFYETEILIRKQLKYPPFCDIIVKNNLEKTFQVFKPMPSPIDKIQNRYRWRIIIKGNMTKDANEVLNNYLKEFYDKNTKTNIAIDVNPNNMI